MNVLTEDEVGRLKLAHDQLEEKWKQKLEAEKQSHQASMKAAEEKLAQAEREKEEIKRSLPSLDELNALRRQVIALFCFALCGCSDIS